MRLLREGPGHPFSPVGRFALISGMVPSAASLLLLGGALFRLLRGLLREVDRVVVGILRITRKGALGL